jgi:F0F1-type ATP synthase delta subunit
LEAPLLTAVRVRLSRSEMKDFLFHLRHALKERVVTVRSAAAVSPDTRAAIEQLFPDKETRFEVLPALGGGLQAECDDTIVDISVRRMIARTFTRIKESL